METAEIVIALIGYEPGLPELLFLVTNCYFSAASLKFVTFVTTLPKVVTISLQ